LIDAKSRGQPNSKMQKMVAKAIDSDFMHSPAFDLEHLPLNPWRGIAEMLPAGAGC